MKTNLKKASIVFKEFQSPQTNFSIKRLTSGHINKTFLVQNGVSAFILQRINTRVFPKVNEVMENMEKVAHHLKQKKYPRKILRPLAFKNGDYLWEGCWRIVDYFQHTYSFEQVQSSQQAFAAAKFLGEFHAYTLDLNLQNIKQTIPGFIDFNARLQKFETALKTADPYRCAKAALAINFFREQKQLVKKWDSVVSKLPRRLLHADPKISNFLFSQKNKQHITALIDWDTLMVGPMLYDFGDMVRSYTNLRKEDDPEAGLNFGAAHYRALKRGFLYHLKEHIRPAEQHYLDLAGAAVVYIQGVRFLTDYLANDEYYATQYPDQNLNRAKNQLNLYKELQNIYHAH